MSFPIAVVTRRGVLSPVLIRARGHEAIIAGADGPDDTSYADTTALVEQAERAKYLREAIDRLPPRQRQLMLELLAEHRCSHPSAPPR